MKSKQTLKYKYSRKEALRIARDSGYGYSTFEKYLLAKQSTPKKKSKLSPEEESQKIMMEQVDNTWSRETSDKERRVGFKDSKPIKEIPKAVRFEYLTYDFDCQDNECRSAFYMFQDKINQITDYLQSLNQIK